MNSVPARLRPDLEIQPRPATDGPAYVLKDPQSGDFFRLREAEYFVARQFDGNTSLEVIRERAEAKFGATLPPKTLATFVKVLIKSRLLDSPDASGKEHPRKGGFVRGNPLYLRFKLCDPDRLLEWLTPRLKNLYTPWFLAFSGALILLALGTTIANRSELADEFQGLLSLASLPFIVLVVFALVSVHELAHGVTCKRYGGEVHEMGFMLIYFQPALYCNVSDAWLFPERRQRLWVGFAGPYVEVTLWAVATIVWRLTDPETAIHGLALIVMAGSGFKTLLNFSPMLKFDGYYLLSDFLDVPNLRRKSFRYIGARIKRLFGGARDRLLDVTPRLKRIYLWYGLTAFAFSYATLVIAIVIVGDYFINSSGPIPIVIGCLLVAARVRTRIARLFGSSSTGDESGQEEAVQEAPSRRTSSRHSSSREGSRRKSSSRHASPRHASDGNLPDASSPNGAPPGAVAAPVEAPSSGAESRPESPRLVEKPRGHRKPRRGGRATRKWLVPATLAAAVVAIAFTVRLELRIAGPFNVLPQENADVRAPLEQIIEEIYVDEGQAVKVGDPIARLDDRPLRAELASTEASIQEARAILRRLEAGPTTAEIDVARAGVTKGEDTLMYAQRRLEKASVLYRQGLVSQKELEDAEELASAAANDRTEADSRLKLLEKGTRPEEIAATRAKIEQLESQRRYLEEQRARVDIVSPVAGVVATPTRQLKELRRQLVHKGDLILKVYEFSTVTAQIFVSERELEGIAVGQRVELRARAYPDTTFHGTVTAIATSAQGAAGTTQPGVFTSGTANPSKSVIVTTEIDNRSLLLKPEMTGQAKIFCGPRRIADLIARRADLTFKVAVWSWW